MRSGERVSPARATGHVSDSLSGSLGRQETSPRAQARSRAILVLLYLLSSTLSTLFARSLASSAPSAQFRARFLPAIGFLVLSIGAVIPQWLPHMSNRLGIEVDTGNRGSSSVLIRRALPIAALSSAAALCAMELPNLVSPEAEQAIKYFAAPIVLLIAPVFALPLVSDRLHFCIIGLSAFFAYALLSEVISPRGALLSVAEALFSAIFSVLSGKWLASSTKLQFTLVYAPTAAVLCLVPALATHSVALPRIYAPVESYIREAPKISKALTLRYAAYVLAFAFEQAVSIATLQSFASPLHTVLLSLPKASMILVATWAGTFQHNLGLAFTLGTGLWLWADEEASFLHLWRSRRSQPGSDLPSFSEKLRNDAQETVLDSSGSAGASRNPILIVASLIPFAFFLLRAFRGDQLLLATPYDVTRRVVARGDAPSLDLVFSYFEHDHDEFANHVKYMREVDCIAQRQPRVIIYTKSKPSSLVDFANRFGADEVHVLPNVGREGHTYLSHIIRNYGRGPDPRTGAGGLADQTAFCQDHLSWHGVAEERLKLLKPNTGYLHFAPYVASDCGLDLSNQISFSRMRDIYTLFREELSAWSAQFFVSRKRVLANSLSKYVKMLSILEAPTGHWLHNESSSDSGFAWGESKFGPENPLMGHALERSWPVIFRCDDPMIAERCDMFTWESEICQCWDR